MSLEVDGGELVSYSSLQECEVWFENGEPCHTLLSLFHSSIRVLDSHLLLRLSLGPGGWGLWVIAPGPSAVPSHSWSVRCRPLVGVVSVQTWGRWEERRKVISLHLSKGCALMTM